MLVAAVTMVEGCQMARPASGTAPMVTAPSGASALEKTMAVGCCVDTALIGIRPREGGQAQGAKGVQVT